MNPEVGSEDGVREWAVVFVNRHSEVRTIYVAAVSKAEASLAEKIHGRPGERVKEIVRLEAR